MYRSFKQTDLFATYTDVDHIVDNIYLGNVNAASNLNQLKSLVRMSQ